MWVIMDVRKFNNSIRIRSRELVSPPCWSILAIMLCLYYSVSSRWLLFHGHAILLSCCFVLFWRWDSKIFCLHLLSPRSQSGRTDFCFVFQMEHLSPQPGGLTNHFLSSFYQRSHRNTTPKWGENGQEMKWFGKYFLKWPAWVLTPPLSQKSAAVGELSMGTLNVAVWAWRWQSCNPWLHVSLIKDNITNTLPYLQRDFI